MPARIHSQMPRGPELFSANPYEAKMPDVIEMNENPTANEVKLRQAAAQLLLVAVALEVVVGRHGQTSSGVACGGFDHGVQLVDQPWLRARTGRRTRRCRR